MRPYQLILIVLAAAVIGALSALSLRHKTVAAHAVTLQPGASMRRLQPGDSWTYGSAAGVSLRPLITGIGPLKGRGSAVRRVVAGTLDGRPVLMIEEDSTYAAAHVRGGMTRGPFDLYITQGATGGITELGDSASRPADLKRLFAPPSPRRASPGAEVVPGSWSVGAQSAYNLMFENGDLESSQMRVVGQETVMTSMGPIATWKVQRDTTYSHPGPGADAGVTSTHATEWWSPDLGAPVREDVDMGGASGMRAKCSFILESTTVGRG